MLELTDIEAGYGRTRVLHGVTVPAGKVVAVLGHNGAGKTTLLKLLVGVLAPQRGTLSRDGVTGSSYGVRTGGMPLSSAMISSPVRVSYSSSPRASTFRSLERSVRITLARL